MASLAAPSVSSLRLDLTNREVAGTALWARPHLAKAVVALLSKPSTTLGVDANTVRADAPAAAPHGEPVSIHSVQLQGRFDAVTALLAARPGGAALVAESGSAWERIMAIAEAVHATEGDMAEALLDRADAYGRAKALVERLERDLGAGPSAGGAMPQGLGGLPLGAYLDAEMTAAVADMATGGAESRVFAKAHAVAWRSLGKEAEALVQDGARTFASRGVAIAGVLERAYRLLVVAVANARRVASGGAGSSWLRLSREDWKIARALVPPGDDERRRREFFRALLRLLDEMWLAYYQAQLAVDAIGQTTDALESLESSKSQPMRSAPLFDAAELGAV